MVKMSRKLQKKITSEVLIKKWPFSIEKKIGERRKVKKRGNKTGIKKTEKNRM